MHIESQCPIFPCNHPLKFWHLLLPSLVLQLGNTSAPPEQKPMEKLNINLRNDSTGKYRPRGDTSVEAGF